MGELGAEFQKINRIVGFFNELATGDREGAKLIAIGSSDPTAFLHAAPATAAAFAVAIERAVALYAKILDIRKSYADLKKANVPEAALKGLLDHVDVAIKQGLEEQAERMKAEYFDRIPELRRPEMNNELHYVLGQIAERLDDGYRFDVRGSSPAKDAENAEEVKAALEVIQKHRPSLIAFDHTGTPILRLSDRRDGATGGD